MVDLDHMDSTLQARDEDRAIHLRQCKLVVVKGSQRGKEHVVASDVIRIGKANINDLVLSEDTVSRVHCEIIRDPRGYLLRDLQSTNGTFLNKARIATSYLKDGDMITIEKYALTVKIKTENDINIALNPEGEIQLLKIEKPE